MARVLGVGVGLFVLAFVWALFLFVALLLSRAKGPAAYGSFGLIAAAALLTLILAVIPRESQFPQQEEEEIKIIDYTIVYRSCLLAACGLFLIIGFVIYIFGHLSEPIHAKPLRKIRS